MRTAALVVLALLAAGCIQPDPHAGQPAATSASTMGDPTMTAGENRTESTGLCLQDLNLGPNPAAGAFCATRVVTVKGELANLGSLPVALRTFVGDVVVHDGPEGSWGFTATLVARGATPSDATRNLDEIDFRWSHEDEGAHALSVSAKTNGSNDGPAVKAALDVVLPASLVLDLEASSGSGDVRAEGIQAEDLVLHSGSGSIRAAARAQDVVLRSGSGDIEATLHPIGSGKLELSSGSGSVSLRVPEDALHGYAAALSTGSGKISITLQDGKASDCPSSAYGSAPCQRRSFETSRFADREIQTQAHLSSGSGDIALSPA